jgi:hypothetical protein
MTTTTMVNGFACKTCTDIDYAKKHIDPAHPKDGPYGVDARDKPKTPLAKAQDPKDAQATQFDPAVTFGGRLQNVQAAGSPAGATRATASLLDVRV